MELKVGDRVLIKSEKWYNENKDEWDNVFANGELFKPAMTKYLGKVVTVYDKVDKGKIFIVESYQEWLPFFCIEKVLTKEEASEIEKEQMRDSLSKSLRKFIYKNFSPEEFRKTMENNLTPFLRKDTSAFIDSFTVRDVMKPDMLTLGSHIRMTNPPPWFLLFTPEKEPLPPTEEIKLIKRNKFLKLDA